MKHVHYSRLEGQKAIVAQLATQARCDTLHGGAGALTLQNELASQAPDYDLPAIVSDIYSHSTGAASRKWEAWECPECGQAHLGIEAAFECCQEVIED